MYILYVCKIYTYIFYENSAISQIYQSEAARNAYLSIMLLENILSIGPKKLGIFEGFKPFFNGFVFTALLQRVDKFMHTAI